MKPRHWAPWFWAAIVLAVLIHNGYLWWQQRLVPDSNILSLLPADKRDPLRQRALAHMVEAAQQKVIILIGAAEWDQARRTAAVYRQALAPFPHLVIVGTGLNERSPSDWLATFREHRSALLTAEDSAALQTQTQQYWLDTALAKIYSPFGGPSVLSSQEDPFGWFGNWLQARAQESPVRPRDGELSVSDGARHYVLLPLTLRVSAFARAGQQAVMPVLEQARQAATRAHGDVEIVQAGMILHAAAAASQAEKEISIIGVGSLAGILALIWFTFRSLKPILIVALSIGIGYLGALSVASLLFERIHLITLVFGASLIGVAQDYGIYFLCRRLGADPQVDSWQLLRRILPALVLTVVTTLIGYLALALTPFPGLSQMAWFSASGLIFAWLTVVFWFPGWVGNNTRTHHPLGKLNVKLSRWPRVGVDRITLGVFLVFAALIVYGGAHLTLQDDVRSLQSSPQALIDDQLKVGQILDLPSPAQFFLLRGSSPEDLLEREEALKQRLDAFVQKRQLGGYHAISNWVPSARMQKSRRRAIEPIVSNDDGALALLAQKIGADQRWLTTTREGLLAAAEPFAVDEFLKSPASEPWRHLWLGQVSREHASTVALRGVDQSNLAALRRAGSGLDGVEWVDQVSEISALLGGYRDYMGWVLLISYFLVYALLYPRYRQCSWRVLAPTALASLWTLAFLGITGQGLQLFHLLALMLLLGIGVDYGIFIQEPDSQKDYAAWLAIVISALSTLLSFGLLGLSKTPALLSFGLTMAVGISTVALFAPAFRQPDVRRPIVQ